MAAAALLLGATLIGLGVHRNSHGTVGVGEMSGLVRAPTHDTVAIPAGGATRRTRTHAGAAASSPAYEQLRTTTGAVAHWGVCDQPIPYWVDPRGGPSTFTHDIATVLDRVASLTGYAFTYEGARPDRAYGGTGFGGISYHWTTAATDPALRGDVVGMTRFAIDSNGYFTGVDIEFDKTDLVTDVFRLTSDPASLRTHVYLHETGHAMGLDHVRDRNEVMFPTADELTAYGPGDVAGLRAVGIAAGCRPDSGLM